MSIQGSPGENPNVVEKHEDKTTVVEKEENKQKIQTARAIAQSEWRFFVLGFILAMIFGVPFGLWGIYKTADNVTLLTVMWGCLIGALVSLLVMLVWFRRMLVERLWLPAKQTLYDFYLKTEQLRIAIKSKDHEKVRMASSELLMGILSKYGWWMVASWSLFMGFGLVVSFASFLQAALTWKGNALTTQQNVLIAEQNRKITAQNSLLKKQNDKFETQNQYILAQNNSLIRQIKEQRSASLNSEVTQYIRMMVQDNSKKKGMFFAAVSFFSLKKASEMAKFRLVDMLLRMNSGNACKVLEALYYITPIQKIKDGMRKKEVAKLIKMHMKTNFTTNKALSIECPKNISLPGIGLSHLKFKQADFRNMNLKGGFFKNAQFLKGKFTDSNLRRSNFERAKLLYADFKNADLSLANMKDTEMRLANFHNANLNDADLSDANISSAVMKGADLRGTIITSRTYSWGTFFGGTLIPEKIVRTLLSASANLKGAVCLSGSSQNSLGNAYECYQWHKTKKKNTKLPQGCPSFLKGPIIEIPYKKAKKLNNQCPQSITKLLK